MTARAEISQSKRSSQSVVLKLARAPRIPRMRIAVVITGLQSGGSELQLMLLAKALSARHDVLVVSLTPGGVHAEALHSAGITVKQLSSKNPFALLSQVRRMLRSFKPTVVHAWLWHASMVSRFACIGLGVPLISAMRGQEPTRLRYWIERTTRPLVSSYTANSEYIASYYALQGAAVKVIPNGWPSSVWQHIAKRRVAREHKHAVAVSRLVPEKDLTTMMAAMALARDWKLSVISPGPREQELRAQVKELGLTNVEFLGYRSDAQTYIARASCLIHLAFEESSPNTVIEALLLGTPVIASDIPALRELVGSRGILVPNGSPKQVAAALRSVALPSSRTRLAPSTVRAAQVWAQERFALDTMVSAHETLYSAYSLPPTKSAK